MILLGRGMTPRRLNPTPNGLVSSSQSAAWVSHRGPPVQRSILRVRKAEGRANHASTSPTAIETARPRVRADRSHDRDRRRGERGRSEPRAGEQHQPRIDAPEEHHQDDEWECGGQAVRSPEQARRHRAHHNLGAGELGRQQRVQALPVALRSDRRGDLSDDKPDRDACLREGGQAECHEGEPGRLADRGPVPAPLVPDHDAARDDPRYQQQCDEPVTNHPRASHRGDHLALEEGSRKHHHAPEVCL